VEKITAFVYLPSGAARKRPAAKPKIAASILVCGAGQPMLGFFSFQWPKDTLLRRPTWLRRDQRAEPFTQTKVVCRTGLRSISPVFKSSALYRSPHFEPFSGYSASKTPLTATPRRYSPNKHITDKPQVLILN